MLNINYNCLYDQYAVVCMSVCHGRHAINMAMIIITITIIGVIFTRTIAPHAFVCLD